MDSVEKVKQIVTAMESRVQGDDINELDNLLAGLEKDGKDNAPAVSFVKMMRSIGRYLAAKTNRAHPDSVQVLASLARDLEILMRTPPPSSEDADEILAGGIRYFKSLKARAAAPHISEGDMEELKAVILSIDWEISAITLRSFNRVITRLKAKVKSSKIHYSFLRILYSIGGDIAREKANAHMDSINLLRSVFQDYEHLVHNPDMPPEEKKRMIEGDIKAYNKLKRKIVRTATSDPKPASPDDGVSPALSHVTSVSSVGAPLPLNTLPEPGEEAFTPARTGRLTEESSAPRKDVIGDLFALKESPADKLLDAIHLSEVNGAEQETAMAMMGSDGAQETEEGTKNLTPLRTDKDPIPEIESRLNAFFNQGVSENLNSDTPEENDLELEEAELVDADFVAESGEPGEPGEQIPDDAVHAVVPIDEDDELAQSIMDRLQVSLGAPAMLTGDTVFTKVLEDLYHLKQLWLNDPEKSSLLTLLAGLSHYIHDLEIRDTEEKSTEESEQEGMDPDHINMEEAPPVHGGAELEDTNTEEEYWDQEHLEESKEEGQKEGQIPGTDDADRDEDGLRKALPEDPGPVPSGIWTKIKSMFRN